MDVDPPRRLSIRLAVAGLAVLLLAGGGAAWWWGLAPRSRPQPGKPAPVERHLPNDPRLSYVGPYRNVRPDVEYVGDAG